MFCSVLQRQQILEYSPHYFQQRKDIIAAEKIKKENESRLLYKEKLNKIEHLSLEKK